MEVATRRACQLLVNVEGVSAERVLDVVEERRGPTPTSSRRGPRATGSERRGRAGVGRSQPDPWGLAAASGEEERDHRASEEEDADQREEDLTRSRLIACKPRGEELAPPEHEFRERSPEHHYRQPDEREHDLDHRVQGATRSQCRGGASSAEHGGASPA